MTSVREKSWRPREDPERDAKIIRLWRDRANNGLNKRRLGERFGLNWSTITKIIDAADAAESEEKS